MQLILSTQHLKELRGDTAPTKQANEKVQRPPWHKAACQEPSRSEDLFEEVYDEATAIAFLNPEGKDSFGQSR